MQSWNSAQQQRLTEPILEADWYGPCLASGALQPEVLAPGLGEVFIAYLWYSKNTKCFYQFVHWKKFQLDIVFVNVSERNEVVLYHLRHPLVAAECSLAAWV